MKRKRILKDPVSNGILPILIVLVIILIDQMIKVLVKTNMSLHESIRITNWFYITFIENNGMAYGMQIGSKLALSLFRAIAIAFLTYYISLQIRQKAKTGYIICLSMVLAGALGNLIDCMFYGLIFNASNPYYTSCFVSFGEGYAPFLMGKVVDMFYFPIIQTVWPKFLPIVGGQDFVFFSPVFNFADASISVGVIFLLMFYRAEISKLSLKSSVMKESEDTHLTKG